MTTLAVLDAGITACRRCPRLIDWCAHVADVRRAAYADEEYWGGPVPGFGVEEPVVWIVGLAPGAHGANRTGRMFTGDRSGDWLFAALHRAGLATQSTSVSRTDGQQLVATRITAAVHCAPPDNKPTTAERHECAAWLTDELDIVRPTMRVVLALGGVAWTAVLGTMRAAGWTAPVARFGHGASTTVIDPDGREVLVLGSYHPSQQNTFTGRLTESMLDDVVGRCALAAGVR